MPEHTPPAGYEFKPISVGSGRTVVFCECNRCGAMVTRTDVHDDFHKKLDKAIQKADHAYGMTSVIG